MTNSSLIPLPDDALTIAGPRAGVWRITGVFLCVTVC
jgi:hypothetical protein